MMSRICRAGWLSTAMLLVMAAHLGAQTAAATDRRLIEAARNRNAEAVRALLKQKADVKATQPDGSTALHWAAHWDDLETAELLIRAGADVNAQNELGATPLWLSCVNGSAGMIERLLRAHANPNIALAEGETPLMTAARSGSVEAVKLLLASGANVNAAERSRNQTALMWAAGQRHTGIVQVLVEAGADLRARSETRRRRINTGAQGGANIDDRFAPPGVRDDENGGFTPLLFAAQQGDVDTARVLLDSGADVNDAAANGASALVIAVHSGHSTLAAFLLERGADANAAGAGYTALHAAILRGDQVTVDTLLAHGADPNLPIAKGTPVRRASRDWALNNSWIGGTPFWLAARFADVPMMRSLAASGADATTGINDGTTPLIVAVNSGPGDRRTRGVGNVQVADADSERNIRDAATLALDLGADVNAATANGETALHAAASSGFESVVQLLVDKGAKLDVKNKRGQTPLQAATAGRAQGQGGDNEATNQNRDARKRTAELLRKLGAVE
jgi:ankyrin repeat protein